MVRPRGEHYNIPNKEYTVTAALFEYEENGESIFAIMSEDYKPGDNPEWFTFRESPERLHLIEEEFEIIGEGFDWQEKLPQGKQILAGVEEKTKNDS